MEAKLEICFYLIGYGDGANHNSVILRIGRIKHVRFLILAVRLLILAIGQVRASYGNGMIMKLWTTDLKVDIVYH